MYRRLIQGIVERGRTAALLEATRTAVDHQGDRGIRARTALWAAMTGQTNAISIATDFNTLEGLETLSELSAQDAQFAAVWADVESQLVPARVTASIHPPCLPLRRLDLGGGSDGPAPLHAPHDGRGSSWPGP